MPPERNEITDATLLFRNPTVRVVSSMKIRLVSSRRCPSGTVVVVVVSSVLLLLPHVPHATYHTSSLGNAE